MAKDHTDLVIARYFRDLVPKLFDQEAEFGRQNVQAVVWMVGLSVGLATLLLVNWDSITFMADLTQALVVGLLGLVVVLGVSQRLVQYAAESALRGLETQFLGNVLGLVDDSQFPSSLSEFWDREEIVRRFASEFDSDYGFLLTTDASLQECQESYKRSYELWQRHDEEGMRRLEGLVGALQGKTEEESLGLLLPTDDESRDTLGSLRSIAVKSEKLRRQAYLIFLGAGLTFILVVIIVVTSGLLMLA